MRQLSERILGQISAQKMNRKKKASTEKLMLFLSLFALWQQALFVQEAGVEPARVLPHWILSPARLPIPPLLRKCCGTGEI